MNNAVIFLNPVPTKSPQISAFKFIQLIRDSYKKVTIVSANLDENENAKVVSLKYKKQKNKVLRMLNFILFQLKLIVPSLRNVHRGDTAFFWIADKMFVPFFVCRLKGVEINYFLYGNTAYESNSKTALQSSKSQKFLSSRADCICTESISILNDWELQDDTKIRIIHLFVDPIDTVPKPQKTVGMLCRLAPVKCVLQGIEGFAIFHKTHPEYTLEIVGDGVLREECERLIEKLSAQDYIFLKGWLTHEQLFELTPRWKLLLFPTKAEGLPNTMLECMVQSVPVLASPVDGIPDVIKDGENGWLLYSDKPENIANTLCKVIDNADFDSVIRNAKETIENEFLFDSARKNFIRQMETE